MRRKRKRYFNAYQAYRGKSRWKKILLIGAAALAALLVLLALAAWLLFRRELAITGTIRKLDAPSPAWLMEVKGDYHFEEFLEKGGASSDGEVSAFLSKKISKGFYTAPVGTYREGCSVLSAYGAVTRAEEEEKLRPFLLSALQTVRARRWVLLSAPMALATRRLTS